MTCSEVGERTVPYLELDLDASLVRDITLHLDGCSGCRVEMEAVRQVMVRLKARTVPDPGEQFWREFPAGVRRHLAPAQSDVRPASGIARPRRWLRVPQQVWPLALAASVMLLIGAWFLTGLQGERVAQQRPEVPLKTTAASGQHTLRAAAESDLPNLTEADWDIFEDEDPDTILVDMAANLDRRTVDRLFSEI
jgi:hypothetical protein